MVPGVSALGSSCNPPGCVLELLEQHIGDRMYPLQNKDVSLLGKGKTLYVPLIVKLSMLDSPFHTSLQVIFLLTTPSHFIYWPSLTWDTALTHLPASSWCPTSSITRRQCSNAVAFCHVDDVAPSPWPPLPVSLSTMSRCFKTVQPRCFWPPPPPCCQGWGIISD